jgi:hypothetical protein
MTNIDLNTDQISNKIDKSTNLNIYNIFNNKSSENYLEENDYYYVKKYTFNGNEYNIIKYDKNKLKALDLRLANDYEMFKEVSKYRSVIVRNNKVVCFSPEKSFDYSIFTSKNDHTDCWCEDFVDGTMINVFYDSVNGSWEIATKSTVGGNILFFNDLKNYNYFGVLANDHDYSNLTFRSMFFEACTVNNLDLNTLDKKYCYSFVLQHPFNRIVTPIITPTIYLIKIYEILHPSADPTNLDNLSNVVINEINIEKYALKIPYVFLNTGIKFVNKYTISSYEDIKNFYSSDNSPYYSVGTMIYASDGTRTKIRNLNYENVRKLRGNQPKLQYNYLCLKKENKVKEFLYYYPEHSIIFNKFKLLVYSYTSQLHLNYISCFIRKEKPLKEYEFEFKNHMYRLHEKFKAELKPHNKVIDKKFVIDYVNSLHPAQQMFVMNYKINNPEKGNKESLPSVTNVDMIVESEPVVEAY